MDNGFTRALALLACIGFLVFGIIRIGVGGGLLAQSMGMLHYSEFASAIADTSEFLAMNAERSLFAFNVQGYLAYIVAMGVVVTIGAIGALRRKSWGVKLIALYLAMHAALFANYLTINPKIWYLVVGIVLCALIAAVRKPKPA